MIYIPQKTNETQENKLYTTEVDPHLTSHELRVQGGTDQAEQTERLPKELDTASWDYNIGDNAFPYKLMDTIMNYDNVVPIIDRIASLLLGKGELHYFNKDDKGQKTIVDNKEFIAFKRKYANHLRNSLYDAAFQLTALGNYFFEFKPGANGEVVAFKVQPAHNIRSSTDLDEFSCPKYYVHYEVKPGGYLNKSQHKMLTSHQSLYNSSLIDGKEFSMSRIGNVLFHGRTPNAAYPYYGVPTYIGSLPLLNMRKKIIENNLGMVANGFDYKYSIEVEKDYIKALGFNINDPEDLKNALKDINDKITNFLRNQKGGCITTLVKPADHLRNPATPYVRVVPVDAPKSDEYMLNLTKILHEIMPSSFGINPALADVGKSTTSGTELRNLYHIYTQTVLPTTRSILMSAYQAIFASWGNFGIADYDEIGIEDIVLAPLEKEHTGIMPAITINDTFAN